MKYIDVTKELDRLKDKEKAKLLSRYFKTGKGQYGEGDIFLGITVPKQREVAKKYSNLPLGEINKLLKSKVHEHRLTALEILVMQFEKGDETVQKNIFDFYLKNTKYINNWDLVDLSSSYILGVYLYNKPRKILYKLVKSKNIWERRMSIISTLYFIRKEDYSDTLRLSELLLSDTHDLMHKAVGWALREVGKKNIDLLRNFLNTHSKIPRTTLRYAIEKMSDKERKYYLKNSPRT